MSTLLPASSPDPLLGLFTLFTLVALGLMLAALIAVPTIGAILLLSANRRPRS